MQDLEHFFKLIFDDPHIADERFRSFTEDHLQKLAANNGGGLYTTIIVNVTNAYTNYFGNLTNKATLLAVQKALTSAADNIISNFKTDTSQMESVVERKYKTTPTIILEFYPLGQSEYTQATKANIETLMTRMKNAFTAHAADFDPADVTLFQNYPTNYINARNAQLLKIGEVGVERVAKEGSRNALEVELQKSLLTAALNNIGNVGAAAAFFDESIIRRPVNPNKDHKGTIFGIITHGAIPPDTPAGGPLEGATIEVVGAKIDNEITGVDGAFRTMQVKAVGVYTVRVSRPGFQTKEVTVDVKDAGDTEMNVQLEVTP